MTVYTLKNGKSFTSPSLFVTPRNTYDVQALWDVDNRNNLRHIDGIYAFLPDYKQLSQLGFSTSSIVNQRRSTIREKIFLVDPSLDALTGMQDTKQKMFATGAFDPQIRRKLNDISSSTLQNSQKSSQILSEVYPLLQVKPLMEVQVKANADMIISPCIPITSKVQLSGRISFARDMLRDTRTLLETSSLKQYNSRKDLMNVIILSTRVLSDEDSFYKIFDLLLCNNPDHVGIKIDGVPESDTIGQLSIFNFFQQFHKYAIRKLDNRPPSLHFINVNELGYTSYCHAVSNIVCPMHKSPSHPFNRQNRARLSPNTSQDNSLNYYHPINMDYPKFKLQDPFPCSCNDCQKYERASNVPYRKQRMHARCHWLEVKDDELREFRETHARLDIALRDKFARSNRTQLVAYLPTIPIFVH